MKIKMIFSGIFVLIFLSAASFQSYAQDKKEKQVFKVVEDMPMFEGKGLKHFNKWITSEVKYPKEALKEGISGNDFHGFWMGTSLTKDQINFLNSPNSSTIFK